MIYKILASKEFQKDFGTVDPPVQKRIKKKIKEVAENPTRFKHLHPPMQRYCRIRIGKLRVIFSYNLKAKILYLEKIIFGHRY